MEHLIYQAIKTPDGTILESTHRHDYKTYVDANGEKYMIDGGLDYKRRSINKIPAQDISLTTNSPHKEIRKVFTWGTYGKNGDQPLKRIKLMDITDEHLDALVTLTYVRDFIIQLFKNEIEYRKNNI